MLNTIPESLFQIYQTEPDRTAIIFHDVEGDDALTYREILHGSAGVAGKLDSCGITPGDPVVLILQHGNALIASFFGTILQGAIPAIMPFLTEKLSPQIYRNSLSALIEITKPVAIITYTEFENEVLKAVEGETSVREVLLVSEFEPVDVIPWDNLPGMQQSPSDIALLQHSSGTTGLQKGVALSHEAIFNQIEAYAESILMTDEDIVVSWLPLYHDMGLIAGFIMPILLRTKLILMSPFVWVRAPYRLLHAVSDHRGTLSWLPNFAFNFMTKKIRDRDLEGVSLASWRAVINCSEPMRWESHQMFAERFEPLGLNQEALVTCYAMAENVFAVTQGGVNSPVILDEISRESLRDGVVAEKIKGDEVGVKMLSAGRPIRGTQLRILDQDYEDLPERHFGEVALKSACMLSEYFNRRDLTSGAFTRGWYLTGDIGYIAEGELFVVGRRKELIIVGGKNIHPQDIEDLAGSIQGVHPGRVVAFGVFNDDIGTEDVVVVAEVDTQDKVERDDLARTMRDVITRGSDIVPRTIKIVDRDWLVKTSSGKIARSANRDRFLHEQNRL